MTGPRRRRPPLAAALGLAALILAARCAGPDAPDPRAMSFPALEVASPEVRRVAFESGTVLYLLPDREIPMVDVKVLVRTGAHFDPDDRLGLAELTGRVMRTGGAGGLSPEEMNSRIEGMGAILESSMGRTSGSVFLSVLSEDLEEGVDLLARVIRRPAFAEEELEKARNRRIEELRRGNDDPDTIAFRQLRPLLYGPDPRGRLVRPETIAAVTRSDLVAFHSRFFRPGSLVVGVSGDFDVRRFLETWETYFGDWKAGGREFQPLPAPTARPARSLYTVAKEIPQSTIVTAWFAPPKESRDHVPFTVLNYILGGAGFNSRLTEEIRSNRGLSYSVGSFYTAERGYGVFGAYCRTGVENTVEAARLLTAVIEKTAAEGVTTEELDWARQSILNSLIFSIDSSAEIVSRKMGYEYDGLPPDYLEEYARRIGAVSLEEVNEAAKKYLPWTSGPMVIVGGGEDLAKDLESLGEVTRLPLETF